MEHQKENVGDTLSVAPEPLSKETVPATSTAWRMPFLDKINQRQQQKV